MRFAQSFDFSIGGHGHFVFRAARDIDAAKIDVDHQLCPRRDIEVSFGMLFRQRKTGQAAAKNIKATRMIMKKSAFPFAIDMPGKNDSCNRLG